MEDRRRFEEIAGELELQLPGCAVSRTRDAIQIDYLGDRGVTLLLTPEYVDVRLPAIDWTQGSHGPVASSRSWRRYKIRRDRDDGVTPLLDLVHRGLDKRRSEFRRCRFCGKDVPVEHRTGNACHGCASAHLGIVY